jgi:transcriptional regulator with XRE-family HTH domain
MTQQQFAVHLGVAITTAARWETSRPPSGPTLAALIHFAKDSDRPDLQKVFEADLITEAATFHFTPETPATDPAPPLHDALAHLVACGADRTPTSPLGRAYRQVFRAVLSGHSILLEEEAAGRLKTEALGPKPRLELARTQFFLQEIQKEQRLAQQRKGLR